MFNFRKPKNELELILKQGKKNTPTIPDEMFTSCPGCSASILSEELIESLNVCLKCGHHFKISARQRLNALADAGSFDELFGDMESENLLGFPEYEKKLHNAKLATAENEAVICGTCEIGGNPTAVFIMEGDFMMGSMGTVVGEKITRLFEHALKMRLPVVGYTISGGARMQEGILSLMQMAKTSGAVMRHGTAGLLYIAVLTNPTTGGVTASFAMEGDMVIAEPGALICFAGPRVIAQTTRQKLPPGFQTAEFLLEKGFIDAIVPRKEHKNTIAKLLYMHRGASE